MATRAMDLVTVMKFVEEASGNLEIKDWISKSAWQNQFFELMRIYGGLLREVTGLSGEVKVHRGVIPPQIEISTVLDKLVRWKNGRAEVRTIRSNFPDRRELDGFELPPSGVDILRVNGYPDSYLLKLMTQSNDELWLFVHPDFGIEGLDLVELFLDIMHRSNSIATRQGYLGLEVPAFAGAVIPMMDFEVHPDIPLSGACGVSQVLGGTVCEIGGVTQRFRMRMDETGARVIVQTHGFVITAIDDDKPKPFVVRGPVYVCWVQRGIKFPMATCFVDGDGMRKPSGSLENM